MKKIVIMMLVAIVPLLTIAQDKKSKAKFEYMMIKGVEVPMMEAADEPAGDVREMALLNLNSENVKLLVVFDYGDLRDAEVKEMMERQRKRFKTMMSAVNTAAEKGWEFINSNVISENRMKTHYYYMKRKK